MAASGKSLAERISRWDTLVNNLEPLLAEWPHLADEVMELKAKLGAARDLWYRQDALRAEAQANTAALNALADQGDKLRYRIGAGIRSKLGFTSDLLFKYGFRPRPTGRRVKKKESPEPDLGAATSEVG